jgi:hypothetical protein
MKKLVLLPTIALAGAMALPTSQAQAIEPVTAGIVGGLAVGALAGSAAANTAYYGPRGHVAYVHDPAPVVVAPRRHVRTVRRVVRTAPVVAAEPVVTHAYAWDRPAWGPSVRVGYGYGAYDPWW